MLRPGQRISDELIVTRRIGGGDMGEVWMARQSTLQTDVAVKFILDERLDGDPMAAGRFRREALNAARIHSEHVVSVLDYAQMADGTPYIVMELVEGESLDERIERTGPLTVVETAKVLRQTGAALDAAAALGIVHRDIKPHNIFLTPATTGFCVKVLDFGNAKSFHSTDSELSSPGMLAGSPAYVSRDLLLDPSALDHSADLWALAVTAFKCLTGELPFRGKWLPDTVDAIIEGRLRRPSKLRPELGVACDVWFGRAFSFDTADRPSTGAEMAQSFMEQLGVEPVSLPAPLPAPSGPRSASQYPEEPRAYRRLGVVALAAALLALVGVVACTQLDGGAEAPPTAEHSGAEVPAPVAD